MRLRDLLDEIGTAAAYARDRSLRAATEFLDKRSFDEMSTGESAPKMHPIRLGPDEVVHFPEYSKTTHNPLRMKTFSIEIETDLQLGKGDVSDGYASTGDDGFSLDISLRRGLLGRRTHARIKAEFEISDPPEGLSILEDRFTEDIRRQLFRGKRDD